MSFNFLAIVFVFGLLVLIHELGHFLAAKWMGVRVEKFSIGFPPKLFGKKIGDTEYCVSAIPLGGYVKMSGMIDESMDGEITGADYEFNSKPVWKRVVIIVAGVVMNLFLAILILSVMSYSRGEKVFPTTEIGYVGTKGVTQKVGFAVGDKIVAVNGVAISSWNEFLQNFLSHLNQDIVFEVVRDDRRVELIYKQEWFREKEAEYLDLSWMPPARIGDVLNDSPAQTAGFINGDEIIDINGSPVSNWDEMTKLIRIHPEEEITIDYKRAGKLLSTRITPDKYEESDSTGNLVAIGKIGVGVYYERHEVSLPGAVANGFKGTFALISLNMNGLWWVISGAKSASEVIGGPIMIAKMANDAAAEGWGSLWNLIAALSAILAFFNILPIPALDGGHLVFLLIEAVTRKPVSTRAKIMVQQVGMAILLTLIVFILYIDIRRLLF